MFSNATVTPMIVEVDASGHVWTGPGPNQNFPQQQAQVATSWTGPPSGAPGGNMSWTGPTPTNNPPQIQGIYSGQAVTPHSAPLVNFAHVSHGAYATCTVQDNNRDIPLRDNVNDDVYQCCQSHDTYTINFPRSVEIDTLICRMYSKDGRNYTFLMFDSSPDGVSWFELIPKNSIREGTFEEVFQTRTVKKIRVRATNTVNAYLHFVRFQAFRQFV